MRALRDAFDALRGRIEHGDECPCHRCNAETVAYTVQAEREARAADEHDRTRKAARKAVRRLTRDHGLTVQRAMRAATAYDPMTGRTDTIGTPLDRVSAPLPYSPGVRLVVTIERDAP